MVNYLIDSALIFSFVNCGGPHPSVSLTCPSYPFEKTIQSGHQRDRAFPYHDGIPYADILNRSTGPSAHGHRVRFSPSLSSTDPASAIAEFISPKRTSVYSPSAITTLTTSNPFASIASTIPLMEGSILNGCPPPVRRFLNVLIPPRSPSVILNVVLDLNLLLLVPGCQPHLLRLPPGPEPNLVPFPPSLPLRLLFQSTLNPQLLLFFHSIPSQRLLTVPIPIYLPLDVSSSGTGCGG